MRTKVVAIWSLLFLTLVFLLLAIFSSIFDFHDCKIVSNISFGVFGSGLVSFIVVLIEYLTQLKRTEEEFYVEYTLFLNNLVQIKYFYIGKEEFALSKYLTNKNMFWKFVPDTKNEFIKNMFNDLYREEKSFKNYSLNELEEFLDSKSSNFDEKLSESLESIVKFSEFNLLNLDRLFVDLFYIFNNKKRKKEIYDNLYHKAHEIKNDTLKEVCHFRDYLNGKGQNTHAMAAKIYGLFEIIYKEKIEGNTTFIYAEKFDNLSDELLKFYCKMYKKEYRPEKHYPIFATIKNCNVIIETHQSN